MLACAYIYNKSERRICRVEALSSLRSGARGHRVSGQMRPYPVGSPFSDGESTHTPREAPTRVCSCAEHALVFVTAVALGNSPPLRAKVVAWHGARGLDGSRAMTEEGAQPDKGQR